MRLTGNWNFNPCLCTVKLRYIIVEISSNVTIDDIGQSLWNLVGGSALLPPSHLPNFKATEMF